MIELLIRSIGQVRHRRYFETERGYQGALAGYLNRELEIAGQLGNVIAEEEFQKTIQAHGFRYRPDIVIHTPAASDGNVREGNRLVILLKLNSDERRARGDFAILDEFLSELDYESAAFINISSNLTYATDYDGPHRDRVHFLAVCHTANMTQVHHHYFAMGQVEEANYEFPLT